MSLATASDGAETSRSHPTLASEALKIYSFLTTDDRPVAVKPTDNSDAPVKPAWRLFRSGKGAQYDMAHVDSFLKFDIEQCRRHGLENTIFQLPIELCNVAANERRRSLKTQGFLIWAELCDRMLPPENSALKVIESATNTALEFRPVDEPCCWRYLNVNALNEKLLSAAVLFLRQIFEFNFIVKFEDMVRICYKCWRRQEVKASTELENIIHQEVKPKCLLNCAAKMAQPDQNCEQPTEDAETGNQVLNHSSAAATRRKVVPSDLLIEEDEVQQIVMTILGSAELDKKTERKPECNTYSYQCTVRIDSRMFGPLIGKHGCTAGIIEHLTSCKVTFMAENQISTILVVATNQNDLDRGKSLSYLLAHGVLRFGNMYDTLARIFFSMSKCPAACKLAIDASKQNELTMTKNSTLVAPAFKRHIPLDEPCRRYGKSRYFHFNESYKWKERGRRFMFNGLSRWNRREDFKQGKETNNDCCCYCSKAEAQRYQLVRKTAEATRIDSHEALEDETKLG
ncbi:hypothetical protein TTRE_0000938201 [Trichuris trichiura]|uniref:K Homology domain-containing protein n=1 Tax=Trichuris trichiura TaxID=36087 RepID=A0A077ZMI6_TRITR|nr:hypothetical protein TTRE_0000938201 [Trichuris trichiura]